MECFIPASNLDGDIHVPVYSSRVPFTMVSEHMYLDNGWIHSFWAGDSTSKMLTNKLHVDPLTETSRHCLNLPP